MFLGGLPTSNSSSQIHHPKYTSIKKGTVVLDQILHHYFNDSLLHDVICENYSSHSSESIKSIFTVSRHIKEPPTVLKILFQRGSYDSTTLVATKNEFKVGIPSEYMFKLQSSNEKISYTLVSLINHDGDSSDCGHYVSDVFDGSTVTWWHCDDENIAEISDLPKGVYYRETHKPTKKNKDLIMGYSKLLFVVYIRTSHLTKKSYNFFEEFKIMSKSTIMNKISDEKTVFRSEVVVRKDINDEIQRIISYIKDEIQISLLSSTFFSMEI